MPKPHYKDAPEKIRDAIESASLRGGQWEAMRISYAFGFNWLPGDVLTPLTKREAELLATGDRVRLAEFRAVKSVELTDERRCLAKSQAMQVRWAHEPTVAEAAAIGAAERERAAKEQAIHQRTNAILAGDQMKREGAARALAVKQSKEIES
jgi:hypothetical protein